MLSFLYRDSAADTEAQDVAGLTAVSSLQDLLDEEEVETTKMEGEDAETKSAVSGVEDGGHATSPVDERPGSAGRSSSVESDGNELNWYVHFKISSLSKHHNSSNACGEGCCMSEEGC